jgi:hypothetical protein
MSVTPASRMPWKRYSAILVLPATAAKMQQISISVPTIFLSASSKREPRIYDRPDEHASFMDGLVDDAFVVSETGR